MKVRDLAKELNISTRAIIGILQELGYQVRSPMSTLSDEMISAVKNYWNERRKKHKLTLEKRKEISGIQGQIKKERRRPRLSRDKIREKVKKTLYGKARRKEVSRKKPRIEKIKEIKSEEKVIVIPGTITLGELAKMMGVIPSEVIAEAMKKGIFATINQQLDLETITVLAERFGFKVTEEEIVEEWEEEETEELTEPRPPVVTVMGHVDHGKTTLLDYIRKTNIAEREIGEITQHIGASRVLHEGNQITFIDTPGHEAFTTLRARGAQVTDIVILVVSAVEGVKPQTVEALNHARAAGVPVIVAVNKIDLPDADPERVRKELSEHGLIPEEWGGDTIFVEVSAKTGEGVDILLDAILLMADELDLRTTSTGKARGIVLESHLEKGRGPVATVIIQRGTLKIGDPFVAGTTYGKVRAIYNELETRLQSIGPSDPGLIQGFNELPHAGDKLLVVDSEPEGREIAEKRKTIIKEQKAKGDKLSMSRRLQELLQRDEVNEVPIIVKADCQGSVEAIVDSLSGMKYRDITVETIHSGIGNVTESDIMLASASNALIIGFNVQIDPRARQSAKHEQVEIRLYRVIYELLEDIQRYLRKLIAPEVIEEVIGTAEVRQIFNISKVGTIAGCYVLRGVVRRNAKVRVMRDGNMVFDGKISSLKRFKENVREVAQGFECGIKINGFDDIMVGDILEVYTEVIKEKEDT